MALNVGIARSDRPELVASFRKAGQTQQQIAEKLNVTDRTIKRDTADLISKGHLSPSEITVTNSRGQERPATYSKPAPENAPTDMEREAAFVNDMRLYILHVGGGFSACRTLAGCWPHG